MATRAPGRGPIEESPQDWLQRGEIKTAADLRVLKVVLKAIDSRPTEEQEQWQERKVALLSQQKHWLAKRGMDFWEVLPGSEKVLQEESFQAFSLFDKVSHLRGWLREYADDQRGLDLEGEELKWLPVEIEEFKDLRQLSLSENHIQELPPELMQLICLEGLYLDSNDLRSLPKDLENLQLLQVLHLTDNQLSEFPESLCQLPHLTSLSLGHNALQRLPENLHYLSQLQVLNVSYNELTELPKSFSQLTKLCSLNLQGNQLQCLPRDFGKLANLRYVDLSRNAFQELPESLEALENLEWLNLSGNTRLSKLPEGLSKCKNLKTLDVTGCSIDENDEVIQKLREKGVKVVI